MDCNINRLRWTLEDNLSTEPFSNKTSPRNLCLFYNKDFFSQPLVSQPPIEELYLLNPSLILNEPEDTNENAEIFIHHNANIKKCFSHDGSIPRLFIQGNLYDSMQMPNKDELSFFKKRESMISTETSECNTNEGDDRESSLMTTDSKLFYKISDFSKENNTNFEIECEKSDRRMTTFNLKRFNSFSVNHLSNFKEQKNLKLQTKTKRTSKKIQKLKGDGEENSKKKVKNSDCKKSECNNLICKSKKCSCNSNEDQSITITPRKSKKTHYIATSGSISENISKNDDTTLTLDQSSINGQSSIN